MDYKRRLKKLRDSLIDHSLVGILISTDANWEYFAGIPRLGNGNTKQRQNSLEYAGLLVTEKETIVFLPRLTSLGIIKDIENHSWLTKIVIFDDWDIAGKTFTDELKGLSLKNKRIGVIQDVSSSVVLKLRDELNISCVNVDHIVQDLRSKKEPAEIDKMRKASAIADAIFDDIFRQLAVGVSISEIKAEIDRLCLVHGAKMTSFPTTILNHGPNSGEWVDNNYHVIEKGHLLAFDYGVVYDGYCSDFGRTISIGTPDDQLVEIHELLQAAQAKGIELLRPKLFSGEQVNLQARKIIDDKGYKDNFFHRLGHGIGLDVHERPFLADGEKMIIESGMLFTVEPSIFIPQKCLIRLEDVVLVGEKGPEILNKTSKELFVID